MCLLLLPLILFGPRYGISAVPVKCPHCGLRLLSAPDLDRHMKSRHRYTAATEATEAAVKRLRQHFAERRHK